MRSTLGSRGVCTFRTVQGQGFSVNATCCDSTPSGYEGIGIVKMLINTTRHPPHYWGGWVPATIKIKSDTLITATAFLPEDVNATLVEVRATLTCGCVCGVLTPANAVVALGMHTVGRGCKLWWSGECT
jgi:hypothetical protein